jgi:hypothetical protein
MTLFIPGRGLKLEAILREPRNKALRGGAVLCHPHPAYGGTMENRVVFRAAKAVLAAELAALRFNFRGAGASGGAYDEGIGEKDDVVAAIDWLEAKYPRLPLVLIGFSFGSWVGLRVACKDFRIKAVVGLGLPLNFYDFDFLVENEKPSLYIVGTQDEFCPLEKLDFLARRLPQTSSVHRIQGADHFFGEQLEQVQSLITGFFRQTDLDRV